MNKLLRKITAGLLSAAMILSGLGTFPSAMVGLFSYADDDHSPKFNAVNLDDSGTASSVYDMDNWYALEITTGNQPGDCVNNIIISYTDDGGSTRQQVLTPNKTTDYPSWAIWPYWINNYDNSSIVDVLSFNLPEAAYRFDNSGIHTVDTRAYRDYTNTLYGYWSIPCTGSRYSSFSTALQYYNNEYFSMGQTPPDTPVKDGVQKVDNPVKIRLQAGEKYVSMSDEYRSMFKSIQDQMKDAAFASNSTEQLIFRSEFPVSSIQSVSFYCEGTGYDSWDLKGWTLYSIAYVPVITGWQPQSGVKQPYHPLTIISSGTFISDRLSIGFNGNVIASSKASELKESLTFNNAGMFTFFNENSIPSFNNGIDWPYTFSTGNNLVSRNASGTNLVFSINIQDSYSAGIEYFNGPWGETDIQEMLTARISYLDINGNTRMITVPVFSNAVLDYITETYYKGSNAYVEDDRYMIFNDREPMVASKEFLSFAQQGESVVFSVNLDNFKSLVDVQLNYNNKINKTDSLIIKDITVYKDCGTDDKDFIVKDLGKSGNPLTINYAVNEERHKPFSRSIPVSGGVVLDNVNPVHDFILYDTDWDGKLPQEVINNANIAVAPEKDYSNLYMVEINTSNVNFADTTDDVMVSFSYRTMDGKDMVTQEYSLQERCHDFYGYTPGYDTNRNSADGGYNYCMRLGGTLKFFIELQNLYEFKGMTVRLAENAEDDWQMSSVKVYKVIEDRGRTVSAISESDYDVRETYGGITINHTYDRDLVTVEKYSSSTKVYVQSSETENIDLEKGTSSGEVERRDWSDYYYEMEYEIAASELHFDDALWKYQVVVNVQKNSIAATMEDDCGSNNLFYFQLVFERGTSAYVLANQQLQHDGFRAGEAETFLITVNENMGELTAVNIIADDTTEDAQELDKLCIDTIEVIKSNPDTANKRYVCDNVGWINIVYQDTEEDYENEGRTAGELVTSVPVTYSGYMLSLEVDLAIDSYTKDGVTADQFVGGMKVNVVYRTASGEQKSTGDLDMVELMYDYANRSGSSEDLYGGSVSDPRYMFRGGSINRFIVGISDAASIVSMTISGKPKSGNTLPLAGIGIKIIKSDGNLIINDNGDFERIYSVEPALLTDEIPGRNFPMNLSFVDGQFTSYPFTFAYKEIPPMEDEESIKNVISREPVSSNDTLNLFVYMQDGAVSPKEGNYKLTASVSYASVACSDTFVNVCSNFSEKHDGSRVVLYAPGLSASNLSMITNLTLNTEAGTPYNQALVDYVIVQQVRNGVAINTYKIEYLNHDAAIGMTMSYKTSAKELGYGQKVSLLLGEGTKFSKLVPEEYDIALAIEYTSKASNDSRSLKSAYVFASDSGIDYIKEGSVIDFNFTEAYIDEIVSVEVIALNGITAYVDGGNIVCRSADEEQGGSVIDRWYSIFDKVQIDKGGTELELTDTGADGANTQKRATFTISTMEKSSVVDSGGNSPIKMVIGYMRATDELGINGEMKAEKAEYVIDDIRKLAIGEFAAGNTAEVSVFLRGVKNLIYVEFIPYDNDPVTTASWNVQDLNFSLEGGSDSTIHTIPIERTFYEREDTADVDGDATNYVNISTMTIGLIKVVEGRTPDPSTEPQQQIVLASDEPLEFGVYMSGGNTGYYAYFVDHEVGGGYERVTPYTKTYGEQNLEFENTTDVYQLYRLTVMSVENPALRIELRIDVMPRPQPEITEDENPVLPVTDEENSVDTTGGEGTDQPANPDENSTPSQESNTNTGSVDSASKRGTKKKEEETSFDA